ncbi:MAG: glycoside hydrolase family 3 protein [Chloroflexi bacterium]|nr:glycoside hydrolase family 3 protein [Chloroflexota bacterium]
MASGTGSSRRGKIVFLSLITLLIMSVGSCLTGWFLAEQRFFDQLAAQVSKDSPSSGFPAQPDPTQATGPAPTDTPSPGFTSSPVPPATPTPSPTTNPWVESHLASMTLDQKVGQMIMMGVTGTQITQDTCALLREVQPGAVIYTGENTIDPDQVRRLSQDLQDCMREVSDIPLIVAVDHEGQYVTRFQSGVTIFPAAQALGAVGDANLAYRVAKASGQELGYAGINMVLGPDADVLTNLDNGVIAERSFGGDPQAVARMVGASVQGYLDAGLLSALKHFPGHGGVSEDSHLQLPVDPANRQSLEETYLPPFRQGIGAGAQAVMFSHVAFPALDPEARPSSLSAPVVDLLRQDLHFDGIALTDAIEMGAITGSGLSVPEASLQAAQAGIDMIMVTSPGQAVPIHNRLLQATNQGELSLTRINQAVGHVLKAKASGSLSFQPGNQTPPDWQADRQLAYEAGYRSVAVLKNEQSVIPLPNSIHSILIIAPEDDWGMDQILSQTLEQAGFAPQMIHFSAPSNGSVQGGALQQQALDQAQQVDLTIFLSWDAHLNRLQNGDEWQTQLIQNLLGAGTPLIWGSLKSPTDLLEAPQASSFIATFGTTPGQLQALADILVGKLVSSAKNPFPALP